MGYLASRPEPRKIIYESFLIKESLKTHLIPVLFYTNKLDILWLCREFKTNLKKSFIVGI